MQRFFISAIGTDAGKTFITTALIHQLRAAAKTVHALKPVASGVVAGGANSDADLLAAALGNADAASLSVYAFTAATSPDIAAKNEGIVPDWHRILDFCTLPANAEYLLIEGAGGLFSPLTETHSNAELALALDTPVLLVAGTYLGAISHTIATLLAARAQGIRVAGIILNQSVNTDALTPAQVQVALSRMVPNLPPMLCVAAGQTPETMPLLLEMLGISA